MISADKASKLLDDVIFERVVEHIDTAGLREMQLDLWASIAANGVGGSDAECRGMANAMIERALRRFTERATHYIDMRDCDECVAALEGRGYFMRSSES